MSALDFTTTTPFPEPPSKRRRVDDDDRMDSTPRYSSPGNLDGARDSTPPHDTGLVEQTQGLSIRRERASRSQSGERYNSRSPTSSCDGSGSRSRSPSRSRSRSLSRSRSRSPTPYSRSQSRSRSRSQSISRSQSAQPTPPSVHRPPIRPNYQPHLCLKGHMKAISQVRISPDGRWIASASADATVKIWDAATGECLDTIVGHMAGISCLAWAPDSNTIATGSDDKAIRLWDRLTGNPAHAAHSTRDATGKEYRGSSTIRGGRTGNGPLLGHHNYVYCLAFSPKGNILASGSYDEAVFLWDVRAGRLMRSLPAHSDPVSGIGFCNDGTLVVSCSTDGLIRVWDTSTGQCLRTLVHEDNPAVTNVCFSPNGRFVLAFNLDNSIRLWDYVSGTVKKTYQGHNNKGFSIGGCFGALTYAEDGYEPDEDDKPQPFIVSASEDGDIVMWDVVDKRIVQRIKGAHNGVCFWVDVNGKTMVSCGQDNTIKVFRHRPSRQPEAQPNGITPNGVNGHAEENGVAPDDSDAMAIDIEMELQRQIEGELVKQELI
ncbi:WD40-repeat-containing domain protein [Cercophora samala]|uniref:Mitochondrial division protein 1 n=1 Tax=Cercophora samala TaxID=330535 RepID=A0AA39Z8E5_9PEZI|nr:WD40-repeat-containing domain protein [Cercophora samala]